MLNEEVQKYRDLSGDDNPNTPISRIGGYLDGYERALEQFQRTGRWIANGETFRCSECGELACCQGRYCPDCGVKMQGVES